MHKYSFPFDPQNLNTTYGFVFSRLKPPGRILDIGAGPGVLSLPLITEGFDVLAIEREPEAIRLLESKGVPCKALDVESPGFEVFLSQERFQTLVLCDLIEHLQSPEQFFETLARQHESFEQLVLTIPNVSHMGIILQLMQDQFRYTETGILDKTHLRFFTQRNFTEMVEKEGFRVVEHHPIIQPLPSPEFTTAPERFGPEVVATITRHNPNAMTYQHCFILRYDPEAPLSVEDRYQTDLLSVVVRTIDGRLPFLDQTLFSLSTQRYRPLEAIIVYQGESHNTFAEIEALSQKYLHDGFSIQVIQNATSRDERAKNLNLGVREACGQYLAFLDDDDVIYPEHYEGMIRLLKENPNAWVYSDVCRMEGSLDSFGTFYARERTYPFRQQGYNFLEHWNFNFIPIHSFMLDRFRVPKALLVFDERFLRVEDYDFLLRLASQFRPLYWPRVTCEYRIRNDGSNSVMDGITDEDLRREKELVWDQSRALLEIKKKRITPVAWMSEVMELAQSVIEDRNRIHGALQAMQGIKRYRMVDRLNNAIKRIPGLHRIVKGALVNVWPVVKRIVKRN